MCGRFTLAADRRTIVEGLDIDDWEEGLDARPRYNVAPTQICPIVVDDADGRHVRAMRWGLVPSWAEDPSIGAKMINARSETLREKPSFKRLVPKRRCVVLTDGFYEWQPRSGGGRGAKGAPKLPHHIHRPDGGLLPMAGLWTTRKPEREGEAPLVTFTIVTTDATPELAPIHHRMPVILDRAGVDLWLDTAGGDPDAAMALTGPWSGELVADPVSRRVNDVANDDPDLVKRIVPIPDPPSPPDQLDLL